LTRSTPVSATSSRTPPCGSVCAAAAAPLHCTESLPPEECIEPPGGPWRLTLRLAMRCRCSCTAALLPRQDDKPLIKVPHGRQRPPEQ
jgi:hypothetical protein